MKDLGKDFTIEKIKAKLEQEPEFAIEMPKIPMAAMPHINAIKNWIGQAILESGIAGTLMSGAWFKVADSPSASRVINTISVDDIYYNVGDPRFWGIPSPKASGRYGEFFQNYLFMTPSNPSQAADITLPGVSTSENKGAVELKSLLVDKMGKHITKSMEVGGYKGAGIIKKYVDLLLERKKESSEEARKYLVDLAIERWKGKMENLLLADIETQPSKNIAPVPGQDEWGPITEEFRFSKLAYFYQLMMDNLIKLLNETITVDMVESRTGNSFIGFKGMNPALPIPEKGLKEINIKVSVSYLELPPEKIAENADKLYQHKIDLFRNIEEAKRFFTEAVLAWLENPHESINLVTKQRLEK